MSCSAETSTPRKMLEVRTYTIRKPHSYICQYCIEREESNTKAIHDSDEMNWFDATLQ